MVLSEGEEGELPVSSQIVRDTIEYAETIVSCAKHMKTIVDGNLIRPWCTPIGNALDECLLTAIW